MSWAEVSKINNNFNKTLNEQARELAYSGSYLFTESVTFTPDKSGWYKIIVVGAGGETNSSYNNSRSASGGSGGVAIKTMKLSSSNTYPIIVDESESVFNSTIIATAGTDGSSGTSAANVQAGEGGTASGGDFNYHGNNGEHNSSSRNINEVDVGVFIPGLMLRDVISATDNGSYIVTVKTGWGILGYGSCSGATNGEVTSSKGGCVLIIPLELEE